MGRYVKRQVTIEAWQLTEFSRRDTDHWPKWLLEARAKGRWEKGSVHPFGDSDVELTVIGPTSTLRVRVGDWIVRDQAGTLTQMDPESFLSAYEPEPEKTTSVPLMRRIFKAGV